MDKKINAMYFSATGTTKKVVCSIAEKLSEVSSTIPCTIDFTLPTKRIESMSFAENDLLVIGVPVYAGRVPNVLLKYINTIKGDNTLAVPVVLYGNRNYDDALIELNDILEANGFKVIAAGAFIGEHSFSKVLASGRPDKKDLSLAAAFADMVLKKLASGDKFNQLAIKGNKPYSKYYQPKNNEGVPVDIRKVTPKTNSNCNNCKYCASVCPMGSIDYDDVSKLNGICIKCGACIKGCPVSAKYYDDENYLRHKHELEINFSSRQEPEFFI